MPDGTVGGGLRDALPAVRQGRRWALVAKTLAVEQSVPGVVFPQCFSSVSKRKFLMSVSNRRFALLFLSAAVLPVLAACGGSAKVCVDPQEPYLSARSQPPLRTPEGLTQPDRSAALAIPEAPPKVDRSGSGCLYGDRKSVV